MWKQRKQRTAVRGLAATAMLAILLACQTGGRIVERLDESNGITVTSAAEPLVFARTEARYSRSGRDYLYLGPVQINRQGQREYFLWVGIASTLDRGFLAPEAAKPLQLIARPRGEPMPLDLAPPRDLVADLALRDIYRPTVPVQREYLARVSLHQLALIAEEPLSPIQLSATDGSMLSYVRWNSDPAWFAFLQSTALEQQPIESER
jgi:hypothetical protein